MWQKRNESLQKSHFGSVYCSTAFAQDTATLPYMDSKLSPEQRAADLVHRMTLEEKASQVVNQARAIPRLKVPAYDWWSEALHGAVRNIFRDHHYRPTQPQASAISLVRGMDNECTDFAKVTDDHDYRPYIDAVQQGYLPESAVDTALVRLFTARIRLGMFDSPELVPYHKIDEKELDSAEHRSLARLMANESMVLLKNDGVLPLKSGKRIAIVGPLAEQTAVLLGNYNGTPTHTVSVLEGMKAEFPDAKITYVPGTQFLRNRADPVPASALTTPDGKPGLKAEYGSRPGFDSKPTSLATRVESEVSLNEQNLPEEAKSTKTLSVQ
jgi:beta-glucosidase